MTNAEIYQKHAIEAKEEGALTSWEIGFLASIENLDKKGLNKLSSKQYDVLRKIAHKSKAFTEDAA